MNRKQADLYSFLSQINILKTCDDNDYKEVIESILNNIDVSTDQKKLDYLIKILSDFNVFSTDLKKHLMVKRDEFRKTLSKVEKSKPIDKDEYLNITDSSNYLGVSRRTIYNYIIEKKINTISTSKGKQVITKSELERFQNENT